MKRKIIQIDQLKCNGCGECIPNCPEGALQIVDGKARLVSDVFCDGLGACIKNCPQDAIRIVERRADAYDENRVMENIISCGTDVVIDHLNHLKNHGEEKLYAQALEFLKHTGVVVESKTASPCAGKFSNSAKSRQWPLQLKLLNPEAGFFDNAEILVSADCVAHAYKDFHEKLLGGKVLVIFCPKLDPYREEYIEKLTAIFKLHAVKSVTVARMSVPCCGGTTAIVSKALELSGKDIPMQVVTVSTADGTLEM